MGSVASLLKTGICNCPDFVSNDCPRIESCQGFFVYIDFQIIVIALNSRGWFVKESMIVQTSYIQGLFRASINVQTSSPWIVWGSVVIQTSYTYIFPKHRWLSSLHIQGIFRVLIYVITSSPSSVPSCLGQVNYYNSYFPRAIREWNFLPPHACMLPIGAFKEFIRPVKPKTPSYYVHGERMPQLLLRPRYSGTSQK